MRSTLYAACALLLACTTTMTTHTTAAKTELAPNGKLRAAINLGNPILANRGAPSQAPHGVSVDLATELARRLGVGLELVIYEAAGKVVDGAKSNAWDIAFVAIDPVRGQDMLQTPPYVVIEGAYLVTNTSPLRSNDEVDKPGARVSAAKGSAYDLYLSRELKQAKIVHSATSQTVIDVFLAQKLDVAAGVKQQLEADALRIGGLRLLPGRFMVINQAMATPKGRDAGARYLHGFVEEMKASGFVVQALTRHGIQGAAVAPPAP